MENRAQMKDSDQRKISMIYFEFVMNMFINCINSLHFMLLVFIRGLQFGLFTHFVIGKTAVTAVTKLFSDVSRFRKFRQFMKNLEKDFPLIKFKIEGA